MYQEDPRWHRIHGPVDPGLQGLHDLWLRWRGAEKLPHTSRFDPQRVAALMPWLVLADIVPAAIEARNYDIESRFIGSSFSQYFSADNGQRMRVSEIGAPFSERWFAVADTVLAEADCCSFRGTPYDSAFPFTKFEMCVLPFTTDGVTLDSLLLAFAMSMTKPAA